MQLCFDVQKKEDGFFLRDFLRLKKVSSSLCSAVKRDKGFFCNGRAIRTNERVHAGDVIVFELPSELPTKVGPQELPLFTVYEDEHAIVLEKPVGQAVHPTLGYANGTLANAFCGEMRRRGTEAVFRPVNRIDRGTSGLVLCAMNAYAAPILAETCEKVYYAVVEGHLSSPEGVIDAPIDRCPDSLIKRRVSQTGKPSRTEYRVLCETEEWSLVRCVPVTGRTHQIRVHFSWMGHPLAGDDFYGGRPCLSRPALHCGKITFTVFKTIQTYLPLPYDMRTLLPKSNTSLAEDWLFSERHVVKEM